MAERPVLPLPIEWERQMNGEHPRTKIPCPSYAANVSLVGAHPHWLSAVVMFDGELVCWFAVATCDGVEVYRAEHRERDEACGACVVAMQRALDVRHP